MIIFDLGGVLLKEAEVNLKKAITSEWNINNYESIRKIFNRTFEFANKISNKNWQKDWLIGNITAEKIIKNIKDNIDDPKFNNFFNDLDEKNLIKFGSEIILDPNKIREFTEIFPQGLSFVNKCKLKGISLAIFSNWDPESFHLIKTKFPDLFKLFEQKNIFIPAKIGYIKPEVESYKFILQTTKMPATNMYFIDDNLNNVEVAKTLGIKSILHKGNWQETESELINQGIYL